MRALVFAAGVGSRLKPWTDEHPKALAPVGGVPMLERVILKLKALGIAEIVVNVHHFAQQIIDFIASKESFGITVHISDEREMLLDTGGGMLKARRWLESGDFLVHNADIITDVNLEAMIAQHSLHHPIATLLVSERQTSRYFLFDDAMALRGWENTKTDEIIVSSPDNCDLSATNLTPLAFGGIHLCSPDIFPLLQAYSQEQGKVFSITPFYISSCGSYPIEGYVQSTPYSWLDIGKPATLEAANSLLK